MIRRIWPFIVLLNLSVTLHAQRMPFPRHVKYAPGSIKPNHLSQQQLDKQVTTFYIQWKKRYVKHSCTPGEDYIWFERPGNKQSVSEGQGYGMMITALMAGYDPSAKATFDALFRHYKSHPAKSGQHLMGWAQGKGCKNTDHSSATDGDMDIAYALLLADKEWGSSGLMNYSHEARLLLADIMRYEINPKTYNILISNGAEYDSADYYDTRSSDFMPLHLRAFKAATGDARWDKVLNNTYRLFITMQNRYSPDAGLLPDFIRNVKHPRPAKAYYLESKYDGAYNYNACRVPWRIGVDYLLNGDARAKAITGKINRWLRETTKGNPDNISAGYSLEGNDLPQRYFEALSFIGPFAVSAMTESRNQQWLNSVWDYLIRFKLKDYDYYDNSIKMLDMIIISGNYWGP
ncbi:glycosyl hydrolase family 8 [Mucilaginibacter boryungensis]|uniref:Glucanase n=1 Tax=Mucilaginibacter boryungensis TaxID=768480 RepID=A0ABR9XL17_9SPHI|nr:glycosyl hydrolase family 8 [Mucilaginibacter boryungensis]MBE9667744.1 beta-glucanase [Mucilaginibacter boryungensis]